MDNQQKTKTRHTKPGKKRLLAVLSILLSFILGLPFWRKLTEIHRAPLPFTVIEEEVARALSTRDVLPCHFHLIFTGLQELAISDASIEPALQEIASRISRKMELLIRTHNASSGGCLNGFSVRSTLDARHRCFGAGSDHVSGIWPCGLMESNVMEAARQDNDAFMDEFLHAFSLGCKDNTPCDNASLTESVGGSYTILILNGHEMGQQQRTVIGKHRHAWITGYYAQNLSVDDLLAALISDVAVRFFMNGASYENRDPASRGESIPIAADGKAVLSFSLLNAEPRDWVFDWDFHMLEDQFLSPVVKAMESVAHLTIESQVLYFTPKAARSYWDKEGKSHFVSSKDLPFFVNANEWHLDTSTALAGRSKLLQFVIYVPAAAECPLYLKSTHGEISATNGFTSPGWGGVVIYNPSMCLKQRERENASKVVQQLSVKDLEHVMQVVVAQLRTLFGLPPALLDDNVNSIYFVPATMTALAKWELDVLLRRRAAADVISCTSTLGSLSRLVQSLPNMVIMDEIGDQVRSSLLAAEAAHKNALTGNYVETAEAARKARSWAEAAFFQPSIMSLLYFPLEHHFAIYTPFFVPVLLHTFLAALKEVTRYYREYKKYSLRL